MADSGLRKFGIADNAAFYRTWFRPKIFTHLTLRQLKSAIFSIEDKGSNDIFIGALAVTHTFVQFHHRFITDTDTFLKEQGPSLDSDKLIVPVVCELFSHCLHPTDSLPENAAKQNFTNVMKNAIKMRWNLDYTNLNEEMYNSLPAYGDSTSVSLLQVPITKLDNFDNMPFGNELNLTFEHFCQFLILCSYHQKTDLISLQYHTIISLLVALTKSAMNLKPLNQMVLDGVGVDPKFCSATIVALKSLFVKDLDDATASGIFERLMTFLPDSLLNLKMTLESEVESRLEHFYAVVEVLEKYADFPWFEIVRIIPKECAAFVKARTLVRSDKNYTFKYDLGIAQKQRYRSLCYLGQKLELEAGGNMGRVRIFMPHSLTRDRLDAVINSYCSSRCKDHHSSVSEETQVLDPELKQLYESLIQKQDS